MRTGVCTNAGRIRDINQDDYAIHENGCSLYIIADGMGGHQCGEVASRMAVEVVQEHVKKFMTPDMDLPSAKGILYEAFSRANKRILDYTTTEPACAGMGTTLTLLFHCKRQSLIGHVGDSRAYVLNGKKLVQVTEDHSLVAELIRQGELTDEEAQHHPQRHVITRALGMGDSVRADLIPVSFRPNDRILLCTDGLTNLVDDADILKFLLLPESEQIIAEQLVELANKRGGYDNITVLLATFQHDQEESR